MEEIGNSSTQQTAISKRKRNLPGNPDPDAEVIALSPKSLMAKNRFVCEICGKGFQREQNLQLHRRGHNLPWTLKQRGGNAAAKRRRVYVCPETTCVHHHPSRALGDLTGIKKHFCRKHGDKKFKCERCNKKYAVQSDWKAHTKTCGTKEYRCDCGTLFSRKDSFITHRAFCDALAQESVKCRPLDEGLKVTAPESSSSPPLPLLTPSTGVLSPVVSVQSSDLPENQSAHSQQKTQTLHISTPNANVTVNGSEALQSVVSSSTMAGNSCSVQLPESMNLSLSSPLFLSSNNSPLFPWASSQDLQRRYVHSPQPVLSATALLQKAAQIGATSSRGSFLCSLGLSMPSSVSASDPRDGISTKWNNGNVKEECRSLVMSSLSSSLSSGLGLGLIQSNGSVEGLMDPSATMIFSNDPPTLDFLGVGAGMNDGSGGLGAAASTREC